MERKHNELENIEFPEQKIVGRNMEKEVKTSFIEYSMSVITSRALPDVRDGMKPGQRRILYAMYEDHLTYDKPFRKSATPCFATASSPFAWVMRLSPAANL
ncbi:MAG: hypothetical protein J6V82_03160, partial [Clostridia bacterium]|nr:hypothetical protein [Clostridia bacterium]